MLYHYGIGCLILYVFFFAIHKLNIMDLSERFLSLFFSFKCWKMFKNLMKNATWIYHYTVINFSQFYFYNIHFWMYLLKFVFIYCTRMKFWFFSNLIKLKYLKISWECFVITFWKFSKCVFNIWPKFTETSFIHSSHNHINFFLIK